MKPPYASGHEKDIRNAVLDERERIRKLALEPSEEVVRRVAGAGSRPSTYTEALTRAVLRAFAEEIER